MKNIYIVLLSVLGFGAAAQDNVGIGTTKPDQSAVLDLSSNNKGLLVPRLNAAARAGIPTPAKGLLVYQLDEAAGFYFYNGSKWSPLISNDALLVAADPNDWTMLGNATATATSFLGTTTAVPLVMKVNNVTVANFSLPTSRNIFFGNSPTTITTAVDNYSMGYTSLNALTTGTNNVAIGTNALSLNTGGIYNVAVGNGALKVNTTGNFNLAIGASSLFSNTIGGNNIAMGANALLNNTTGSGNVAFGLGTLAYNTTATNNAAIGERALGNLKTGIDNVGIGFYSAYHNALGNSNVAIGIDALRSSFPVGQIQSTNTRSFNNNVSIGTRSGYSNIGDGNIFLGYQAGYNELGSNNLYISNSNSVNPLIKGNFVNNNLRINVGATNSTTQGYMAIGDFSAVTPMTIPAGYRLVVQQGIITEKLKITPKNSSFWADYVFDKSYKLMTLKEVEKFVQKNHHLPNVPSAKEVGEEGIDLAKMNAKLLEKIEELTLYIINQDKRILKLEEKK
jgi:trimeric autotransporter adhesin